MGTDSTANEERWPEEVRSVVRELRSEIERLRAENKELRDRLESVVGGDGVVESSDMGESQYDRLRAKARSQREAKRRRTAARAAAKPTVGKRGKRSPRRPFEADETIVRDVPAEELPEDARPNGFVDRHFYGVRIARHNVWIRLHEYVSPTQGRMVAKLPEGWSGEFTPDTRVTISTLSLGGMTEPKIGELFADHGVTICAGQINHMILQTAQMLVEEKVAAHRAGVENSPVVGMDGTYSTCDGEPMVCHILGNEVFTSMTTTENKDRVTVMGVLAGEPVRHCVGEHAVAHPDLNAAAREVLRKVSQGEPVAQGADPKLTQLSNELRTAGLDADKMSQFLARAMPQAKPDTLRHMREATAGQWLRTILTLPLVMLADGGTNYHAILRFLQLCWVHILRPFSLLSGADSERILHEGWTLYYRICTWREAPNIQETTAIEAEFDRVFDHRRCTDAKVAQQVSLTHRHREHLLTVLRHPYVPVDNNGQERAAKARVRKRDISFGPRSRRGLQAWDTTQSVVGTLRKLHISPAAFIADRITHQHRFPRLDTLVKNQCIKCYGPRSSITGAF